MRKFKFRFEAVLTQRHVIEELRQHAFAAVKREMHACETRLAACRADYQRTLAERSESLDLDDVARRERYLDVVNARIAHEERVREGIAARLEDARTAMVHARQARRAIERVRERDYTEYLRLAAKTEQDALDEMATLRHGRSQWVNE